jgi:hypothetical protein
MKQNRVSGGFLTEEADISVFLPRLKTHCQLQWLFLFFLMVILGTFRPLAAVELDPYPIQEFSRDLTTITFFREERPSFYWVNIGVPDVFFTGVKQRFTSPLVYSVRSMEHGLRASAWVTDQWQLRVSVPFESNALEDAGGTTRSLERFGDIEVGTTFLLTGQRQKGNFIGIDGWYRFPTGTNPFLQEFPLLSTGKGVGRESIGIVMGQEVGGFSFFQWLHYEKTQALLLDSSNPLMGPGVFQWPDYLHAKGRVEFLVFQRAQRSANLFCELRARMSGPMKLDQQAIFYGQGLSGDWLFFATGGLAVRVDKEFSAEARVTYFPLEISKSRPDGGWLFSLSLEFRPI